MEVGWGPSIARNLARLQSPARSPDRHNSVPAVLFHAGASGLGESMPISSPTRPRTGLDALRPTLERRRLRLGDGTGTTLHVARFVRRDFSLRVVALQPPSTVQRWCERSGADHAIVG